MIPSPPPTTNSHVSAGGRVNVCSTIIHSNRLAAVEVKAPPPHDENTTTATTCTNITAKDSNADDNDDAVNSSSRNTYDDNNNDADGNSTNDGCYDQQQQYQRRMKAARTKLSLLSRGEGLLTSPTAVASTAGASGAASGSGPLDGGRGTVSVVAEEVYDVGDTATPDGCNCCRCCVSLGAGNVMAGNGLDGVMQTGTDCVSTLPAASSTAVSSPAAAVE